MAFSFAALDEFTFLRAARHDGLGRRVCWHLTIGTAKQGPQNFLQQVAAAPAAPAVTQAMGGAERPAGTYYLGELRLAGQALANGPFELLCAHAGVDGWEVLVGETLLGAGDLCPRWQSREQLTPRGLFDLGAKRLKVDLSLAKKEFDAATKRVKETLSQEKLPLLLQDGQSDLRYLVGGLEQLATVLDSPGYLTGGVGRALRVGFPFADGIHAVAPDHLALTGLEPIEHALPGAQLGPDLSGAAGRLYEEVGGGLQPFREQAAAWLEAFEGAQALPYRLTGVDGAVVARELYYDAREEVWAHRVWAASAPAPGFQFSRPSPCLRPVVVEAVQPGSWTVRCRMLDARFGKESKPFSLALSTPYSGGDRCTGLHLLPEPKEVGLMMWSGQWPDRPVFGPLVRPVEAPGEAGQDVRRLGSAAWEIAGVCESFAEGVLISKGGKIFLEAKSGEVRLTSGGRSLEVSPQFVDVA